MPTLSERLGTAAPVQPGQPPAIIAQRLAQNQQRGALELHAAVTDLTRDNSPILRNPRFVALFDPTLGVSTTATQGITRTITVEENRGTFQVMNGDRPMTNRQLTDLAFGLRVMHFIDPPASMNILLDTARTGGAATGPQRAAFERDLAAMPGVRRAALTALGNGVPPETVYRAIVNVTNADGVVPAVGPAADDRIIANMQAAIAAHPVTVVGRTAFAPTHRNDFTNMIGGAVPGIANGNFNSNHPVGGSIMLVNNTPANFNNVMTEAQRELREVERTIAAAPAGSTSQSDIAERRTLIRQIPEMEQLQNQVTALTEQQNIARTQFTTNQNAILQTLPAQARTFVTGQQGVELTNFTQRQTRDMRILTDRQQARQSHWENASIEQLRTMQTLRQRIQREADEARQRLEIRVNPAVPNMGRLLLPDGIQAAFNEREVLASLGVGAPQQPPTFVEGGNKPKVVAANSNINASQTVLG